VLVSNINNQTAKELIDLHYDKKREICKLKCFTTTGINTFYADLYWYYKCWVYTSKIYSTTSIAINHTAQLYCK